MCVYIENTYVVATRIISRLYYRERKRAGVSRVYLNHHMTINGSQAFKKVIMEISRIVPNVHISILLESTV